MKTIIVSTYESDEHKQQSQTIHCHGKTINNNLSLLLPNILRQQIIPTYHKGHEIRVIWFNELQNCWFRKKTQLELNTSVAQGQTWLVSFDINYAIKAFNIAVLLRNTIICNWENYNRTWQEVKSRDMKWK